MRILKLFLFLCVCTSVTAFGNQGTMKTAPKISKESYFNDPELPCWCSQVCNWRKRTPEDHPVYIENDPYGKFFYCKQWDYDHYEDNCIYGRNVQQPPGSK